jgi:hypothetical protein
MEHEHLLPDTAGWDSWGEKMGKEISWSGWMQMEEVQVDLWFDDFLIDFEGKIEGTGADDFGEFDIFGKIVDGA